MTRELDLARLAMATDCEGCIAIVKHKSVNSRVGYAYVLKVTLSNSDFNLIDWINNCFGGSIFSNLTSKGKRYFEVVFNGKDAAKILTDMRPYLIIKSEQARIALEFQSTVQKNHNTLPVSDDVLDLREELFLQLKDMKIVPIEEHND